MGLVSEQEMVLYETGVADLLASHHNLMMDRTNNHTDILPQKGDVKLFCLKQYCQHVKWMKKPANMPFPVCEIHSHDLLTIFIH